MELFNTFAAQTAGTMAQIIVVLLLAAAFSPTFRGMLRVRRVRDSEGDFYDKPAVRHRTVRRIARFRMVSLAIGLYVVVSDCVVVILNFNATGALAVFGIVGNLIGVLAMALWLYIEMLVHSSWETSDPAEK